MRVAVRALLLLAAVVPLFVATGFHPAWWQTFAAAAVGSALGQLAVWLTREHRVAQVAVAALAALAVVASAAMPFVHREHDVPRSADYLVLTGTLTWDDVREIETLVPAVAPYRHTTGQVIADDQNWNTQVVGTTNAYFDLLKLPLTAGFDGKAVVLGATVATQLFGHGGAVGADVRIKSVPFTVIGVLAPRGKSAQGQDLDDVAFVPLDTFSQKLAPSVKFDGVVLLKGDAPVEDVRRMLRERHRLDPSADDDFRIRAPSPQ